MAGMEHFTQRGRRVLALAHQEASRLRQSQICTEHLLMGLMLEEDGVAGRVLRDLGATTDRMREVIEMQGAMALKMRHTSTFRRVPSTYWSLPSMKQTA